MPLQEATNVILNIISQDPEVKRRTKLTSAEMKTLIDLCLSRCYFLWNEEIHELVVMAEGFLQYHEKRVMNIALNNIPTIELKLFRRYVDDSHARFPDLKQANDFKDILNQQHPKIQYT